MKLSTLKFVSAVLESGHSLSYLIVAGNTHLHGALQEGICILKSHYPDIVYKPLMGDQVALIGQCIRGLSVQEPTLLLDAARSPPS